MVLVLCCWGSGPGGLGFWSCYLGSGNYWLLWLLVLAVAFWFLVLGLGGWSNDKPPCQATMSRFLRQLIGQTPVDDQPHDQKERGRHEGRATGGVRPKQPASETRGLPRSRSGALCPLEELYAVVCLDALMVKVPDGPLGQKPCLLSGGPLTEALGNAVADMQGGPIAGKVLGERDHPTPLTRLGDGNRRSPD